MRKLIDEPTSTREAMLITDWNRIAADPQGYASRHYEAMGFPSAEEAVAWLAEQGVNVGRTPDANN